MYILRPDERTTPVMLYTKEAVVRGEAVIKQSVPRVNLWLRTDGAPKYMHLLKAQMLVFGGSPVKAFSYPQLYFPTTELIAFHTLPPTDEPLDYDPGEANRVMEPVDLLVGTFVMKGNIRISAQTEMGVSLEVARVTWMSLYDAVITNQYLPQMPPLQIPMLLVNPAHVALGLNE
ncbi:MAG TPA: hypothetical protein VJ785_06240 [Anaerolineales bacterium]|nr:hypothetical protein [Anaerolineales bacterium]